MKKEKKKYTKPALKTNEPLVNVTFATTTTTTGTTTAGTNAPGGGGAPAPAIT